ncbi:MAG: RluA family pseudouridine synthase [Magnetococcales bacterium]|nr:RluA family pseudouridine synthase [Magnetococcales bacterium]
MNPVRMHLPVDMDGERLDKAMVVLDASLSRTAIQRLIREERVRVDGHLIRSPSQRLRGGEVVEWTVPDLKPSALVAETIALDIRFEDGHLVVINKPAGMVVHPGAGVHEGTLVHALLGHCGGDLSGIGGWLRPGIVHRLDKDTSGLLVVAKSDVVHQGLSRQFEAHTVSRRYMALIRGVPRDRSGMIDAPVGRHPTVRTKMAVRVQGGREAVTRFEVVEVLTGCALVHCVLQTGRTHQIRVHMAHIGHPLLGDLVYSRGFDPPRRWPEEVRQEVLQFRRQALHAGTLGFLHPVTGGRMQFTVEPPDDFQRLLDALRQCQ